MTLKVEKFRQIAEVTISANGIRIAGQESHEDMYAAIDLVMDKIERQVKKYKGKITKHKPLARKRVELGEGKCTIKGASKKISNLE